MNLFWLRLIAVLSIFSILIAFLISCGKVSLKKQVVYNKKQQKPVVYWIGKPSHIGKTVK